LPSAVVVAARRPARPRARSRFVLDAYAGDFFIADSSNSRIVRVDAGAL
jgi:hypothetical protein